VFTYGPLGFVSPNRFYDGLVGTALILNSLFALALALGVAALLPRSPAYAAGALFLLVAYSAATLPHVYATFGLLAALTHFGQPERRAPFTTILLAVAAGIFANVYVSSAVLALSMFLLIDASRIAHRRVPLCLPIFIVTLVATYAGCGQRLADLGLFLRSCFELIGGFPGAMSINGNRVELAAFIALALAALALVLRIEWNALSDRQRRLDTLLFLGAIDAYLFFVYKTGFVRHDLHSLVAWSGAALLLATYASLRWTLVGGRRIGWSLVGLSLAANFAAVFRLERDVQLKLVAIHAYRALVERPGAALRDATAALSDPAGWTSLRREQSAAARASIRTSAPLPFVPGTVDVIPNIQSSVIAHGMDYKPRPVFQDYSGYTPWLIEQNRAHYRGGESADYVLLRPETIDNRYPLLDQGAAVIELLGYYEPLKVEHELLVMKRRDVPLSVDFVDTRELDAALGQWVTLEHSDAPVMLTADISSNFTGRIAKFMLRPPILTLSVRLASGQERVYRLIEGVVHSGILLSPVVDSALAYAAVATGFLGPVANQRVVAFKIDAAGNLGRKLYNDVVPIHLTSLRLGSGVKLTISGELTKLINQNAIANEIAAQSDAKPPLVEVHETELFAHAPTRLLLPLKSIQRLRVSFGIREGAWTGDGATDGVCFRVSAIEGGRPERKIVDRCLDPRARSEDRPQQSVDVAVGMRGPGTLVFETGCGVNCAWDWSYWKDIDVEP